MRAFITQTFAIPTNGILLHAEVSGPLDGRLVILLHGFPEMWSGWENQIPALTRSGFRVVAPDQRGYNLSEKPDGVEAYKIDTLARDVLGIIDYFGQEKAIIVGHDWGAAVAWHVAIHYPERVERLAILNVPHPAVMIRALTKPVWAQFRKSWYIYFFQVPRLPELLLGAGNYTGLRQMMRASSKPSTFSKENLDRYVQGWSRPRALTNMINWYRALARQMLNQSREDIPDGGGAYGGAKGTSQNADRVTVPTLILWGEQDVALIPQLAQWSLEMCDDGRLVRFPDATHWVQHDEAERVNNRLLDFFT